MISQIFQNTIIDLIIIISQINVWPCGGLGTSTHCNFFHQFQLPAISFPVVFPVRLLRNGKTLGKSNFSNNVMQFQMLTFNVWRITRVRKGKLPVIQYVLPMLFQIYCEKQCSPYNIRKKSLGWQDGKAIQHYGGIVINENDIRL